MRLTHFAPRGTSAQPGTKRGKPRSKGDDEPGAIGLRGLSVEAASQSTLQLYTKSHPNSGIEPPRTHARIHPGSRWRHVIAVGSKTCWAALDHSPSSNRLHPPCRNLSRNSQMFPIGLQSLRFIDSANGFPSARFGCNRSIKSPRAIFSEINPMLKLVSSSAKFSSQPANSLVIFSIDPCFCAHHAHQNGKILMLQPQSVFRNQPQAD